MTILTSNPPTSIATRAMLVDLDSHKWGARKTDKGGAEIVAKSRGSSADMGNYTKYLLHKRWMDPIYQALQKAGDEHRARTLPWMEKGPRVLKAESYQEYAKAMRIKIAAFQDAVDYLVDHYDEAMNEASRDLNGSFALGEYPKQADLAQRFSMGTTVLPMPTSGDFRVDLGTIETERVKAQIESDIQAMIATSLADILSRANRVVGKMAESLRAYEPTGDKVKGAFRDTLVANVVELVELLPGLNIMDSPDIDRFIRDIKGNLTTITPEELRDSPKLREVTAGKAEAILVAMNDFFA